MFRLLSLAAACLLALYHAPLAAQQTPLPESTDVVIVGAGLTGLTAASGSARPASTCVFPYPQAVAYWPIEEGRSRFDALALHLRRPVGRVWIGGDTTENSHSEGAIQAAERMAREVLAARRQR